MALAGIERDQQGPGGTDTGRPDPETDPVKTVDMGPDDQGPVAVVGGGPDGFADIGLLEKKQDQQGNDDGQDKGDQPGDVHGHRSPAEGRQGQAGLGADVAPPQIMRVPFSKMMPRPTKTSTCMASGKSRIRLTNIRWIAVTDAKHHRRHDHQGKIGIETAPEQQGNGEKHGKNHHLAVGEIDDLHDPEDQGEA